MDLDFHDESLRSHLWSDSEHRYRRNQIQVRQGLELSDFDDQLGGL